MLIFPLRLDLLDSVPNGLVSYNFLKCNSCHFKLVSCPGRSPETVNICEPVLCSITTYRNPIQTPIPMLPTSPTGHDGCSLRCPEHHTGLPVQMPCIEQVLTDSTGAHCFYLLAVLWELSLEDRGRSDLKDLRGMT